MLLSPLGIAVHRPSPDNVKNISRARELVLLALRERGSSSLSELRSLPGVSPAALSSALLLMRGEGCIRVEGAQVFPSDPPTSPTGG